MAETVKRVYRTTTTHTELQICRDDILSAFNLPADAEISVFVPGGGDGPNTDLIIDRDHEIIASWTTVQEETE